MNKKFVLSLIAIVIIVGGGSLILKSFAPVPSVTPPSVTVDVKQNVENYLRENIVALSPVKAVLGGTWYVVSDTIDLEKNSGTVTYEDGHIQEIKNFSYTTNTNGDVVSLTIAGTPNPPNPVACTMEAKLCPDGSYVGRSGPNCEFSACPNAPTNKNGITGRVTLGPTCPVERIPPDPNCAPKPYATSINILKAGSTGIIKTIQSDVNGAFNVSLDAGSYTLQAGGGKMLPRCPDVLVKVISGQMITADISCDTGIR